MMPDRRLSFRSASVSLLLAAVLSAGIFAFPNVWTSLRVLPGWADGTRSTSDQTVVVSPSAADNLAALNVAYTENFDSMEISSAATIPSSFRVGTDWTTGSSVTTVAYGTTGSNAVTASSAGGVVNWANGATGGSLERALGFLNSSSFMSPRSIILRVTNNTGTTVNNLAITFDYEKYRFGTRQFDWTFFHGPTSSASTAEATGNQTYLGDSVNTVVNPPTTISKSVNLTGLSIPNGSNYYLRWTLTGLAGSTNGQGLGIDNFSITASANAPTIQVTGGPLNFGNQIVGTTSAAQSVTITNTGNANLTLGTLALATGTQFALSSNPSGSTVAPGDSVLASLTFTAATAGAKADTLTIPSNAAGPPPTVSLSGTGISFVADLDQCKNGTVASPVACTGSNWFAGNVSSSLSHWIEGQSVPYRQKLLAFTPGPTVHTVTIGYDTTKAGKHAFDYLTSYDRTETTAMGNDPCTGFAGCSLGTVSTFPIPADPNVSAGFDQIPGNGDDITQVPGNFTMFGGTITGVSSYTLSGSYAGDSHKAITISFTAQSTNLWLAWGGHIASRRDWGATGTAVDVSGSPYHMTQDSCSFTCSSQDRTIGSTAVGTVPTGQGLASPSTVVQGGSTVLTVTVTPGTKPASTTLGVTADLTAIGGSVTQAFLDDGVAPDATAGDNIFTYGATVAMATTTGAVSLPFTVSDAQSRSSSGNISLTVNGSVGTFTLSSATYQVNENAGVLQVTVNRNNGTFGSVQATVSWGSGTAVGGTDPCVPGQDYVGDSVVLTFLQGDTTKTANIILCDDVVPEQSEFLSVSLSTNVGTVFPTAIAQATILDTDPRTRVVDRLDDSNSADECSANPNDCSLRRAIETANDGDTITFDPSVFALSVAPGAAPAAVVTLTNGEIDIASDITITGPGASQLTIDGNNASRIYDVAGGTTVSMSGMTLTNGNAGVSSGGAINANSGSNLSLNAMVITSNDATEGGGIDTSQATLSVANSTISNNEAAGLGGGITNSESTVTIRGSIISGNTARYPQPSQGGGGGIYSQTPGAGSLTITGSTISNNCAGTRSGSVCTAGSQGGGVSARSANISNTVISGNVATDGAGIQHTYGLTLTNSTVSGNTATGSGGGTFSNTSQTLPFLTVIGSTFSANSAAVNGGGIYLFATDASSIRNSTFSANTATTGGNLWIFPETNSSVTSSTFVGGTVHNESLGGFQLPVSNSIFAAGCTGTDIVNVGFNIDSGTTCGFGSANNSQSNTDPLLGPLQNNGGPTPTMALLTGSPAIDAGSAFRLTTDQRGSTRPVDRVGINNADDGSDIGAFEALAPTAAVASISGRVVDANGRGISSAVISVQDFTGTTRRFYTNTFGYFDASGLRAGESYLVSVSSRRHTFAVSTRLVDLGDSISGVDFTATR